MRRIVRHSVCIFVAVLASVVALHSIGAQATAATVDEVWKMEASYWRFVRAGDVEGYRTLWNKDFRGWPCGDAHPATKATIGDWVKEIRDKKIKFTYEVTPEGASSVGGVVVVYYRTPMIYEFPDGHKESPKTTPKFTHTWMKVNGRWEIIGGMCGSDSPRL